MPVLVALRVRDAVRVPVAVSDDVRLDVTVLVALTDAVPVLEWEEDAVSREDTVEERVAELDRDPVAVEEPVLEEEGLELTERVALVVREVEIVVVPVRVTDDVLELVVVLLGLRVDDELRDCAADWLAERLA